MAFSGAVEVLGRTRVSGWVRHAEGGAVSVTLVMQGRDPIAATQVVARPEGNGFVIELPAEYRTMPWAAFVERFDCVLAEGVVGGQVRQWRVPLYKSVLLDREGSAGNRTTLALARLKEYVIAPVQSGRLAAFTIAHDEAVMLPLWAKYYAGVVGPENCFVLDHGSSFDCAAVVPKGVTVVRLAREAFDTGVISRSVAMFQRFLLESHDAVLYSDADEFICADPTLSAGRSLAAVLLGLEPAVGITTGYNLWHDIENEPAYDPGRPVLAQRRLLSRETALDKPLISRVPLSWEAGFQRAAEGGSRVAGLYLLHLRLFDLDHALTRGGVYRGSKWHVDDLAAGRAAHQRISDSDIVGLFRAVNAEFAAAPIGVFDPQAARTVVPAWMREAIAI